MFQNHSSLIPASTVSLPACSGNKPVVAGLIVMHYLNKSLEDIDGEIWKDIVGAEGIYKVSSHGRIKSVKRHVNSWCGGRIKNETIRKQFLDIGGYCVTGISYPNNKKTKKVHCLVAEAFIPNPYNKPNVNHKDGNKSNNHIDNLEWVTPSENMRHAFDNNMIKLCTGERNHLSKFGEKEALDIFNSKEPAKLLADRYGVKIRTIYSIKEGQNWSHVTGKVYKRKLNQK